MRPVICALQPAAIAKSKNRHPHVGALSDAKKATRRAEERVKKQKQRARRKSQGLKEPESAARAHRLARKASQRRHWINGKEVWAPVEREPSSAAQLASDAAAACLAAEGETAEATYYERLHLSGFKAPAEPLARQHATFLQREVEVSDCSCLNLLRSICLLQVLS